MLLSEILREINYEKTDIQDLEIDNVTAKTDLINERTLFILYKGINSDKDTVIQDIAKKNPAAIISDQNIKNDVCVPIISVDNARIAYTKAMYNFCKINADKFKLYAITGSNGKTTTATLLYKIFRKVGKIYALCAWIYKCLSLLLTKMISLLLFFFNFDKGW